MQLLARVRGWGPARIHTLGVNLPLVAHEVVIFVFLRFHRGVESHLGATKALSTLFSLKIDTGMWESVGSLASDSEATRVQALDDMLIVGSRKQVDTVEHTIGQLVRRQTLDVFFECVLMVGALLPRLLGWARLLRQKLLHA